MNEGPRSRSLRWHGGLAIAGVVALLAAGEAIILGLLLGQSERRLRGETELALRYAVADLDRLRDEVLDHAVLGAGIEGSNVQASRAADSAEWPRGLHDPSHLGAAAAGFSATDTALSITAVALEGGANRRVLAVRSISADWVRAVSREAGVPLHLLVGQRWVSAESTTTRLGTRSTQREVRDEELARSGTPLPAELDGKAHRFRTGCFGRARLIGAATALRDADGVPVAILAAAFPQTEARREIRGALFVLTGLVAATGAFLLGISLWIRARIVRGVEALVGQIEAADPDHPERNALRVSTVLEIERLRGTFSRFFERFAQGRARQTEAEGALGHVLRDASDAILVLDRERTILQWNRGAEETLGYLAAEVLGRPYTILLPSEESGALAEDATASKDLRTRRRRKDGTVIDVSLARSRMALPPGGEERVVEILRDVSSTRRLEEELLRSEKMAAVGKISSKVVHEIRNPLAAINLNVDLLAESLQAAGATLVDPEAHEILDILKRETRRLSQIADEYLQFSRLPPAAMREESINQIVRELSNLLRPELARRGVRLELELDPADPPTRCDASMVRQALLNLVRNAVDAVEPRIGQVTLGTRRESDGTTLVEVRDNGRGIRAEDQARIFDPFYTTKRDGTGLGLALVLRAATEHEGRVVCRSTPGQGATFVLCLPSARAGSPSPVTGSTHSDPRA